MRLRIIFTGSAAAEMRRAKVTKIKQPYSINFPPAYSTIFQNFSYGTLIRIFLLLQIIPFRNISKFFSICAFFNMKLRKFVALAIISSKTAEYFKFGLLSSVTPPPPRVHTNVGRHRFSSERAIAVVQFKVHKIVLDLYFIILLLAHVVYHHLGIVKVSGIYDLTEKIC